MSQIETTSDALDALCNGEFFQVGGDPIDPNEIVAASTNGQGEPVFHLSNGQTRVHNQFLAGDVGDLLYSVLPVARRRDSQSQKVKPIFNRFLTIPSGQSLTVVDAKGKTIKDTGIAADQRRFVKVNEKAGKAVVTLLNSSDSKIIDLNDYSVIATVTTAQGADPNTPFSAISNSGRILIAHEDFSNGDLYVSEFDSNGSLTDNPVTGGTNIGNVQGIEFIEGKNTLLVKAKSGSFQSVDLASNTVSAWGGTITGSGFPDGPVQQPGTNRVYYCKDNLWSLDVSSLSNDDRKEFELFNFGSRQRTIAGITASGKIVIANGDGESAIFDLETGEKVKQFPFSAAAAYTDLSVV